MCLPDFRFNNCWSGAILLGADECASRVAARFGSCALCETAISPTYLRIDTQVHPNQSDRRNQLLHIAIVGSGLVAGACLGTEDGDADLS